MKKNFEQPELMVVRLDNSICTDIIQVSNTEINSNDITILSGDRMGREDWDAGY